MANQDEEELLFFKEPQQDEDFGEEVQDWSVAAKKNRVPKRGNKDQEPLAETPTQYDERMLSEARSAMYAALFSHRIGRVSDQNTIRWGAQGFYMTKPRGKFLETMGRTDRDGVTVWLHPEEAAFLTERGSCVAKSGDEELDHEDLYKLAFVKCGDHDRFLCYSHLKRCGYIVQRHYEYDSLILSESSTRPLVQPGWLERLLFPVRRFAGIVSRFLTSYPLLHPLHYRLTRFFSYSAMFSELQTVFVRPGARQVQHPEPEYRISFNVWKPSPSFRKRSPPRPDFQVCVVDVGRQPFPSFDEVQSLLRRCDTVTQPTKLERPDQKFDHKLKYGNVHVLMCIIDQGVMNFVRLNDTNFAERGTVWRDDWLNKPQRKKGGRRKRKQ